MMRRGGGGDNADAAVRPTTLHRQILFVTADCSYRSPQHSFTQLSSTTHGTTGAGAGPGRLGNRREGLERKEVGEVGKLQYTLRDTVSCGLSLGDVEASHLPQPQEGLRTATEECVGRRRRSEADGPSPYCARSANTRPSTFMEHVAAVSASTLLEQQPFDVIEAIACEIASSDRCAVTTLVSLSMTCLALRTHVSAADRAWDALSRHLYASHRKRRLDVRVGFPFESLGLEHDRSGLRPQSLPPRL